AFTTLARSGRRQTKATSMSICVDAIVGAGVLVNAGEPRNSRERYKVQFTASAELRQKLERATNLMRHGNPSGDLSAVVERAMDLLLAELEKQRLSKTARAC